MTDTTQNPSTDPRNPWHWAPQFPIKGPPVSDWPLRPGEIPGWLFGRSVLFSQHAIHVALALVAWYFFTPSLERMATFEAGWIAEIWLRNLVMFTLVTAGFHLWFYTFRGQGDERKFDRRWLATDDPKFLFRNQLWDNVFWSLVSGVTIWTAFEVPVWWCWANGYVPWLAWADNPVWFVLLFFVIWAFEAAHFYAIHRLIHAKALYRFHALHHNNDNIGPWSGISMHPVEHILYFSSLLLHFVLASHPIHLLYHGFFLSVGASVGHIGFQEMRVSGRNVFTIGNMFHQLHHRYYNCNYGLMLVPLDRWFGSFHDGTPEATARINKRTLQLRTGRSVRT